MCGLDGSEASQEEEKTYLQGIYEGWTRGLTSASTFGPNTGNVLQTAVRNALERLRARKLVTTEQLQLVRDEIELEIPQVIREMKTHDPKFNGTRGRDHHLAKLTEEDVLAIRWARKRGERVKDLAARYGLVPTAISNVVTGKTWPHVGGPLTRSPRRMATIEEKARVRALQGKGLSHAAIAREVGRSKSVVARWLGEEVGARSCVTRPPG